MRNAKSWKFISHGEMGTNLEPPVLGPGQPVCTRLRGWCFSLLMLLSALFGAIYMITPVIPLIFWNPKLWRKLMDRLVGLWVIMPGALMEYLFGTKVSIKGDLIEHDEPALIIMNHRTRLDWLFFWNALYRMNPWLCTSEKISMKGILKYVPGAGWAMGANSYIFLDRSFEKDKIKLDSMIQYYASIGYNYQLLLFPEGTDKCPLATERSRVYAEKNNLIHYDYVLQPRTTGFVHIVQTMRRTKYIKYLYDVTVAFPENLVQSEVDMVCHGVCPNKVQYEVRKIPIDALPSDDEGLATWIKKLWAEKEEKLFRYYSKPMEQRSWDSFPEEYKKSEQAQYMQILCIIMWIFTTGFWLTAFFEVTFMMVFAVIAVCIFVLIEKTYGGIEWLAIREFNRSRTASSDPVPLDPTGRLPRPSED